MVRNVISALILAVFIGSSPFSLVVFQPNLVYAQSLDEQCLLDGYLTASFSTVNEDQFIADEQTVTLNFDISNDSSRFTYAGVDIGIALYDSNSDNVPTFWAPVAEDQLFQAESNQSFEFIIDGSYVPAGDYIARVGMSQDGQTSALAMAGQGTPVVVQKEISGTEYQFDLTADQIPSEVSEVAAFSIAATNNTAGMLRDYDQYIVLANNELPLGTAVVRSLRQPVKMMPGATEETSLETRVETEGEHIAIAFTAKENTFLPVVTQTFIVGDESAPVASYVVATGVDLFDQSTEVIEAVSCLGSVGGDSANVMQIEQVIQQGDAVLTRDVVEVIPGGYVSSKIAKATNLEFAVTSSLYTPRPFEVNDEADEPIDDAGISVGFLEQSFSQNLVCDDECNPESIMNTLDTFAAEESVQTALWFYLGIIAASVLLMFLMIGRLTPPKEEEHEPMHEPQ